jgi:hypothetical protein
MKHQIRFGILVILLSSCCPPPGEIAEDLEEEEALEERVRALEKELAEANAKPAPPALDSPDAAGTPSVMEAAVPVSDVAPAAPIPLKAGADPCDGLVSRPSSPQVPRKASLFTELREQAQPQGDLKEGLVLCRVVTRGGFDAFKGPDLSAKITMGDFGPKTIRGGEDQWTMHVSMPSVTLRKGQVVRFSLWDRDVFGSDSVGSAKKKFKGIFPLYLDHSNMDVECRAMGKEGVEAEAAGRLKKLDRVVARAHLTLRPRPKEWDWGLRKTAISDACDQLVDVEGYLGTDDPRVDATEDRLAVLLGQWRGVATKSVEKVRKGMKEPGKDTVTADGIRVTVLSARKSKVVIKVENLSVAEPCTVSPFHGHVCQINNISMVGPDGRAHRAKIIRPSGDASLKKGDSLEVTLRGRGEPVLLRVQGWEDKRMLRIR